MSVYFVYRSHYEGPAGKHVRVLDGDSVLGWFRDIWDEAKQAPDVSEWARAKLGCEVYGFASLFEAAREEDLRPPKTDRMLRRYLNEHLYVEGEVLYRPHALQVLTDDDEIELAYYIFDDHYLNGHPGRAAYLLHEDWRLPEASGTIAHETAIPTKRIGPPGSGPGTTYLAFLAFYDSGDLTSLDAEGPRRIEGVRVPLLAEYLSDATPAEDWPFELKLLRSQLPLIDSTRDRLGAALVDVSRLPVQRIAETEFRSRQWLGAVEHARSGVENVAKALLGVNDHDPSKSLVGTSDHLLQLCLHVGNSFGSDVFHQWIVFDDLGAGANRDLADGILRFARRWDVLSED